MKSSPLPSPAASSAPRSVNAGGKLFSLATPQVMGIINVTPDSFYAGSRTEEAVAIGQRAARMVGEGATMLDIGAYSSRPGADDVSPEEEMARLRKALPLVRRAAPSAVISVDTFRADVARMCVEEYGVHIINDISGGELDPAMFRTVAKLHVPYILMHMQGVPRTMQQAPHYEDLMREIFLYFAERVQRLHDMGVCDLILDPGFGFGKTLEQNYELMRHLPEFREFSLPILVGISRKSMVYKLLGGTPADALNGTTVLNTAALLGGADILRVHDVRQAVEAVSIVQALRQQ